MRFVPLTIELCNQLRQEGYVYLSIKFVYDRNASYDSKTTIILNASDNRPEYFLISIDKDDYEKEVATLMQKDTEAFWVIVQDSMLAN